MFTLSRRATVRMRAPGTNPSTDWRCKMGTCGQWGTMSCWNPATVGIGRMLPRTCADRGRRWTLSRHERRARRCWPTTRRHPVPERTRCVDSAGRSRRGTRYRATLWRPCKDACRQLHEVDDRAPAGRRWSARIRSYCARTPRSGRAPDHQPRPPGRGQPIGRDTTPVAANGRGTRDDQFVRFRPDQRQPDLPSLLDRRRVNGIQPDRGSRRDVDTQILANSVYE